MTVLNRTENPSRFMWLGLEKLLQILFKEIMSVFEHNAFGLFFR